MIFGFVALLAAGGLFVGVLVLLDLGRKIGIAQLARDPDAAAKGAGPVEAAILGLLGLLLAFTFSGAATRFEARRQLVADEANAIGTAYLRVDLLPSDAQPAMRQLFRDYLDTRIETYRTSEDLADVQAKLSRAAALQGKIWETAVDAFRRPESPTYAATLSLSALNDMIDITTTVVAATQNHPPPVVFALLAGLNLISALLVGYATSQTKSRTWFHVLILATTVSLTFYVIIDLEFPRLGLIRIDKADQLLIDLRSTMR
jgi:hypothetical protein